MYFTPLSRVPEVKNVSSSGTTAHFRHKNKNKYHRSLSWKWRTGAKPSLNYANEEEVKQTVEDEELVLLSKFLSDPPTEGDDVDHEGEFNQCAKEDGEGVETKVLTGLHTGCPVQEKKFLFYSINERSSLCF